MARLHPPVPRFDLPDLEFELVVALEDYLDDSYLVLQPSHAPLRELTGGRRPVVVIHPTEGVAAILPVAQTNRSPVLRAIGSRQVDSDPYAAHARLAALQAERWLGLPNRKILGLAYDPETKAEAGTHLAGRGDQIGIQVAEAMGGMKLGPLRPSPEEYAGMLASILPGTRLVQQPISAMQVNYRSCRADFERMRSDHRNAGRSAV